MEITENAKGCERVTQPRCHNCAFFKPSALYENQALGLGQCSLPCFNGHATPTKASNEACKEWKESKARNSTPYKRLYTPAPPQNHSQAKKIRRQQAAEQMKKAAEAMAKERREHDKEFWRQQFTKWRQEQ